MVDSPCIDVCRIHPEHDTCEGCYRTLDEIANWSRLNNEQKVSIIMTTQQRKQSAASGFTLLEITLVLIILAAVVGGITAGKNLLRVSLMDKAAAQIEQIQSGVKLFSNKYQCMPGDCADPVAITGYTYSGNGNNFLENTWLSNENKAFWIHLSASGMFQDALVAHTGSGMSSMNAPLFRVNQGAFLNAFGDIKYGQNVIMIASPDSTGGVSVSEAIYLDEKLDDGIAASGSIQSTGSTNIYAAAPVFPLATSNYSGTSSCVSSGVYVGGNTRCNLQIILEK
jgi:predicted Fe-S protein YdhL (DUF1289 family)